MPRALLVLLALALPAAAQPGVGARLEGRFVRALTAMSIEDFETARASLDEIIEVAPADATVLTARSEVATALGSSADAVYYARQATDAAPESAAAWLGLTDALRRASQPDAAAEAIARARALSPDRPDVLTAAADLAAERGDAEAERDALAALVRVGDTVAARLRLSALAERAGDAEDALTQARAAARLAPAQPAVARRLAALEGETEPPRPPSRSATGGDGAGLFEAGRFAEAADVLLAEIDADPRRVDRWALALRALAETADPRAGATADDALLLYSSVPAVLAAAAEAYAAAGRADDARNTAQRGLDALDLLGDDLPDADALRQRLDVVLSR